MVSDHNTTASGGLSFVNTVFNTETGGLDSIVQDGGIFVVADSAKEYNAVGRENVLGSTSSVLGSTSGNQFGGVVVEEIFVDAGVFLFSEDGIVGLEAVFVEKGLVSLGLDI